MKRTRKTDDLAEFGRFSEPAVLILISLADGPKHGYAITNEVEEVAGFRPGPGTLYGAIARLESRGLIEALDRRGRRRPYRLTARGETALRARLVALEAVTRAGQARLARGRQAGLARA